MIGSTVKTTVELITTSLSRIHYVILSIPLLTFKLTALCICIHLLLTVVTVFTGTSSGVWGCMNAEHILNDMEIYRILTSPFIHGSFIHLAFNMLTLCPLGGQLETCMGSVAYICLCGYLIITSQLVFIIASITMIFAGYGEYCSHCAIGFSGVIFAFMAYYHHHYVTGQSETLGMLWTSAAYPWIMLVLMQFLLPNVSFLGHLCGLLAGCAFAYIPIVNNLLPKAQAIESLEMSKLFSKISSCSNFIRLANASGRPNTSLPPFCTRSLSTHSIADAASVGRANFFRWLRKSVIRSDNSESINSNETPTIASSAIIRAAMLQNDHRSEEILSLASTSTTLPVIDLAPHKIEKVVNMGFSCNDAEFALKECVGNVEGAIELLVTRKSS